MPLICIVIVMKCKLVCIFLCFLLWLSRDDLWLFILPFSGNILMLTDVVKFYFPQYFFPIRALFSCALSHMYRYSRR